MDTTDFDLYLDYVNEVLDDLCGMTTLDLPDYDYASEFEAGTIPREAARRAIQAAGGF